MSKKFIPNGDVEFDTMAWCFANAIAGEPSRFGVSLADSEALVVSARNYRNALAAARHGGTRSPATTREKDEARKEAERHIKRVAALIRVNENLDAVAKVLVGVRERSARAKSRECPQEPPKLRFERALHEGRGGSPRHELSFEAFDATSRAKPEGAVRLELFVDLVSPGEAIPAHPGANHGGRPWYLRSYTRSPIVLAPPMTRTAMRVVYWGRWADSTGNVGPFSSTAVGWIEGGSEHYLPGSNATPLKAAKLLEDLSEQPAKSTFSVTVLEARYQQLNPQDVTPRQLESDAA